MSLKTIQMDPSHLKISKQKKTKKVIVPPSVMIHQPNLRQILLDKLMKHRKTQKRNEPMILNNDFDSQCSLPVSSQSSTSVPDPVKIPASSQAIASSIMQDKPYGVLKNGIKPTYKKWNLSQKNIESDSCMDSFAESMNPVTESAPVKSASVQSIPVSVSSRIDPIQTSSISVVPVSVEPVSVEPLSASSVSAEPLPTNREYKKPVIVGKSKKHKTVRVLIPCHKTRKVRSELHESYKKTNLTTVKNYLKQHKLIKVGSTAPTNLIREIYENARSYGDIHNENKHNLLYNFEKEKDSE
jgi:hypothetical protein